MKEDSSPPSFCSMGGMSSMSSNQNDNKHMHRRKLSHHYHHGSIDKNWDDLPVILPDDDITSQGDEQNHHQHAHDGTGEKDMHNHDDGMDHNDDNNQHSSSHSMQMNQGTIMYMDGFHSALFPSSRSPPPPCLNLFHPSWTLHTPSRFVFAMVFISALGILVEACGVWRVKCLRKGRSHRREAKLKRQRAWQEHQQQQQHPDMQGQQLEFRRQSQSRGDISDVSSEGEASHPLGAATSVARNVIFCPAFIQRIWRAIVPKFMRDILAEVCCCFVLRETDGIKAARQYDLAAAFLHASRAVLGYLLMLAVMSYAVEFLISAVFGMVLGRYWFVDREGSGGPGGGGVMNGAVGVGGGIGGMGMGDGGGRQNSLLVGVNMTDMQQGNDGTWGGGDPCCGIDDQDEDNDLMGDLREPLLSPMVGNSVGVTRRTPSGVGSVLQTDQNP